MKEIEIPFGASNSELSYQEIIIPDGFEAIIQDGKVILRKKESEDEKIRKNCIHFLELQKKYHASTIEIDECIAWLEKQRPKPLVKSALEAIHEEKVDNSNKVEGNFKIGDWIVGNYKENVFLIKSTSCGYFTLEDINGNIYDVCLPPTEDNYHLWSIKDAKDGDVLVASDGSIFIFKEVVDNACKHYIALAEDNETIQVNDNLEHCWESVKGVRPATKEQIDILFQKMKENNWKWDAEKKELKKIEAFPILSNSSKVEKNETKWTEEDSRAIDNCCLLIGAADDSYEKAFKDDCIHYLQNLKQRMEQ